MYKEILKLKFQNVKVNKRKVKYKTILNNIFLDLNLFMYMFNHYLLETNAFRKFVSHNILL